MRKVSSEVFKCRQVRSGVIGRNNWMFFHIHHIIVVSTKLGEAKVCQQLEKKPVLLSIAMNKYVLKSVVCRIAECLLQKQLATLSPLTVRGERLASCF